VRKAVSGLTNLGPLVGRKFENGQTYFRDTHVGRVLTWDIFIKNDIEAILPYQKVKYGERSEIFLTQKSLFARWRVQMETKFGYSPQTNKTEAREKEERVTTEKYVNNFLEYVVLDYLWHIFQKQADEQKDDITDARAYKTTARDDRE